MVQIGVYTRIWAAFTVAFLPFFPPLMLPTFFMLICLFSPAVSFHLFFRVDFFVHPSAFLSSFFLLVPSLARHDHDTNRWDKHDKNQSRDHQPVPLFPLIE